MPSQLPLPSIRDFIRTGLRTIRGLKDITADDNDGSVYEWLMGVAALAWSRNTSRDRDMFRAIYLDTAVGTDLTNYLQSRYPSVTPRFLDTAGVGNCTFSRPNAGAGAGTILAGTRVIVGGSQSLTYKVSSDTAVGASATSIVVPLTATVTGPGVAISGVNGTVSDPLWDPTWSASNIVVADGTTFEDDKTYKARVKATNYNNRAGYPTAIVNTLRAAGAANIIIFPSFYTSGVDFGINACYVSDPGFNSNKTLINACKLAAEGVRNLGCDLWLSGMQTTSLSILATISLWDDPSKFDTNTHTTLAMQATLQYFANQQNAVAYKIDGIRSAISRTSTSIQSVAVTSINGNTNPTDATLSGAAWPLTLTRYVVNNIGTIFTFTGPS